MKAGDNSEPFEIFLFMDKSHPLTFDLAAVNLTALGLDENHVFLDIQMNSGTSRKFDFVWGGFMNQIILAMNGKDAFLDTFCYTFNFSK